MFLDSATLRDNVVSLAKQLGYTPKSITSPKASVSMALTFSGTAPAEVSIKKGSGFVTNFDGSLYRYILKEDMSFEVKIYDRYQRLVYDDVVKSTDKIWSGIDSNTSQIVKTDFYYYEVTPVEYFNTLYVRRRDTIVGTIYLEKER